MEKRNSNIEILRILSIFLIVISHYTVHNGISNYLLPLGINRIILEVMTLGNIGTILFVFISGYFLINSEKVKLSKLVKIWFQIFFYSAIIYMIFVVLGKEPFSIKTMIKSLMPITFRQYWFASVYVVMYIFHPYLNKLINSLNKKEHCGLIMVGIFLFSILGTLTGQLYYGNELIQFFLFYIIGAYFGKYELKIFSKNKFCILTLILTIFILISSVFAFDMIGSKVNIFAKHSTYLFRRTSFVTILLAVSLFNLFKNAKKFSNAFINNISSCMFGVYLISDNSLVRKLLWIDLFKNADFVNSNILIIHMIVCVFSTIVCCVIIEFIRIITLEKVYKKYISKLIDKFQKKLLYIFNKLYKKID